MASDELVLQENAQQEEVSAVSKIAPEQLALIEEMMRVGLFLGRRSSKTHPRMRSWIAGIRNGISVINLEETLKQANLAAEFLKSKAATRGTFLIVGTTPAGRNSVIGLASRLAIPYVTERWLGGTMTNFKTLSKRIAHFKKLKSDRETGRLDKYTKKERLGFDRQIQKMSTMF